MKDFIQIGTETEISNDCTKKKHLRFLFQFLIIFVLILNLFYILNILLCKSYNLTAS